MAIVGAFAVPHPPLIVPEIGKGQEKEIARTTQAYERAMEQAAELEPETVILISPHSTVYMDYLHISPGMDAHGDFSRFGAGKVSLSTEYDHHFAAALAKMAESENIPAGFLGEREKKLDHGSLVPLYFLKKYLKHTRIVRVAISGLSYAQHYRLGMLIKQLAEKENKSTVLVASGDLSHKLKEEGPYGFHSAGPEFDSAVMAAFETTNFLKLLEMDEDFCDAAGECGLRAFIIMAGAFDGQDVISEVLSYEGPFGVGYGVASFMPGGRNENRHFLQQFEQEQKEKTEERKRNEDEYVRLARYSLEYAVKNGKMAELPDAVSGELLNTKAGAFVSLKKDGQLRGCIGTIEPTKKNLALEIMGNAVSAALNDTRFDPVQENELGALTYSVDVLGSPEKVLGLDELDARKYGVIVTAGSRRGLLLPNLEGVDTPKQQIEIALQKANIDSHEKYSIERFEVVRHK